MFRILIVMLLLLARVVAQEGDAKDERMEPVVPEKLIPPSPVLTVDQALKSFKIAPGFVIEAVAAEPLVEKPVCLDFDPAGRMWVCEMRGYMPDIDGKGESIPEGRIVILEDSDGDGRVDKRTVFLDKLLLPRAIAVLNDGILFMDEQRLCWIKRNGDQPVGEPVLIDSKICAAGNVEHKPNGLLSNLDNRYYLAKSDQRLKRTATGWELEATASRGQWGIARDDYGRLYHNNNSTLLFGDLLVPNLLMGNPGMRIKIQDFTQLGSNKVWPARVTPAVNRAYMSVAHGFQSNTLDPDTYKLINTTAAAGMTIYRGTNFPREWRNVGFTTESAANLVSAMRIRDNGAGLKGEPIFKAAEFLTSTDERFRPVNIYNSPDGCLYLLDMYHGIIQHKTYMTSYLRKQTLSRGLEAPAFGQGRIYRIRSANGAVERVKDIAALGIPEIVALLGSTNPWQRETAQRLLVERKDPAALPLLAGLAENGSVIARIHAIWTLEGMGALEALHLASAINSNDVKLQSSALWASTRLAMDELMKLESVLVSAKPSSPEVVPYLARALGPLGTPPAYARLGALLKSYGDVPFIREAIVAGLDRHEVEFKDSQLKDSKDTLLLTYLANGAGKAAGLGPSQPKLPPAELASFQRGKAKFHGEASCFGCHSADGAGMPNLGPPLDESQWVTGKPEILVKILLHGLSGPITVNGEKFNPTAEMPALGSNPTMTDQTIGDLATYIRNEWTNQGTPVSAAFVRQQREITAGRAGKPWTAKELK